MRSVQSTLLDALALHQSGHLSQAAALYEEILRTHPRHFDALHLLGVAAANGGDAARALCLLDRALEVDASHAAAHFNRGTALQSLGRHEDALACYERAVAIEPNFADAHSNRAVLQSLFGRPHDALCSCDRAIAIAPAHAHAHYNRGNAHRDLRQWSAALSDYERALTLKADYPEAWFNLGNVRREMGRCEAALQDYDRAIAIRPSYAAAYLNRGNVLKDLKRMEEALSSYRKAAELDPELEFLPGEMLMTQLQICDWQALEETIAELQASIERGEPAANPFVVLTVLGSAALQAQAAHIWVRENGVPGAPPPPPSLRPPQPPLLDPPPTRIESGAEQRLRIGYFSADFHDHATAYLIAGLLEAHDAARFEISAFSFGPDSAGAMRTRLSHACARFIDVRAESDAHVAALARRLDIDIAVDLKGYTQDNRARIFAMRAAPLQVNFLGFPGTLAAPYIDYLVADRILVDQDAERHYREKLVYMPNSYQVNDRTRPMTAGKPDRSALGLPPGFVFCCFNNNYKILPEVFECWARILHAVEGSVLWLLADNPLAARNLRREAARRRLEQRLFIAGRVGLEQHLARQRAADLFLDTWPCNAHTTASDALWAGLPVLTLAGEAFASRVAASVLRALDLPELITKSAADYERMAVMLATSPALLNDLKNRLQANRLTHSLFDSPRYAADLETAYCAMHARHRAGLPPDHIYVV